MTRRFPPPWTVEQIPSTCSLSGFKVLDANNQSLAYVYGRETKAAADIANVLTMDEARRVASNIAKLPKLLGKGYVRQRTITPRLVRWGPRPNRSSGAKLPFWR